MGGKKIEKLISGGDVYFAPKSKQAYGHGFHPTTILRTSVANLIVPKRRTRDQNSQSNGKVSSKCKHNNDSST